jgi:hypothetical protein
MLAILRAMKDFDIDFEDDTLEQTATRFFEEAECKKYLIVSGFTHFSVSLFQVLF